MNVLLRCVGDLAGTLLLDLERETRFLLLDLAMEVYNEDILKIIFPMLNFIASILFTIYRHNAVMSMKTINLIKEMILKFYNKG